jgi:ABC-type sugar transport system ATPase subunit
MATKGGIFTLVNLAEMRRLAKKWIDAIKIRAINGDARVIELSGGNRQKVVIAKSLVQTPKLIIFDNRRAASTSERSARFISSSISWPTKAWRLW